MPRVISLNELLQFHESTKGKMEVPLRPMIRNKLRGMGLSPSGTFWITSWEITGPEWKATVWYRKRPFDDLIEYKMHGGYYPKGGLHQ